MMKQWKHSKPFNQTWNGHDLFIQTKQRYLVLCCFVDPIYETTMKVPHVGLSFLLYIPIQFCNSSLGISWNAGNRRRPTGLEHSKQNQSFHQWKVWNEFRGNHNHRNWNFFFHVEPFQPCFNSEFLPSTQIFLNSFIFFIE